jgi:hypothetical protein
MRRDVCRQEREEGTGEGCLGDLPAPRRLWQDRNEHRNLSTTIISKFTD